MGNVTQRTEPPVVFLNEEEKRSPNIWTSQSCFASSNWFSKCEHLFFNKLVITEPAVPSARLLGLHSPLWGCVGDWVELVVKVHCGTVLEDALQHGGKFAAQNSPTMHFDNHLDPVSRATSKWRIGHFQVPKTLTLKMRPSVKMSYICMRMKNHFHIKGWALKLVFIQRPGETRKWLITAIENQHIISKHKITNLFYSVE